MSFKKYILLFFYYTSTASLYAIECKPFDALSSLSEPHIPFYTKTYAHQAHTPPDTLLFKKEDSHDTLKKVAQKLDIYQKSIPERKKALKISCFQTSSPFLKEK